MGLCSLILGSLLLAESGAPASRGTNPEVIAQAFTVPAQGTLSGRTISLAEALASARDRAAQLEVTHAYWRLSGAVGEYALRHEAAGQLRGVQARAGDASTFRAARTDCMEALRIAELHVVQAQRTLVDAARLSPSLPLPLPSDLPHAGPYRTGFDEVYASRSVPAGARLAHRTLPLRRQAIEARAAAVRAALDALEAATDAYRAGTVDASVLLTGLVEATRQRAGLVADVCQYNHEIADYALLVAGVPSSPQSLAAMLLLTSGGSGPASETISDLSALPPAPLPRGTESEPSAVAPAAWLTPESEGQADAVWSGSPNGQPTLAPAKPPAEAAEPLPKPPRPIPETDKAPSPLPVAKPDTDRSEGEASADPMPPAPRSATERLSRREPGAVEQTVQRAPAAEEPAASKAPASADYSGLVAATPGARAKHLSAALHWNRNLPKESGRPIELAECLLRLPAADRRSAIDAYWLARQRAAEYEALTGQGELLDQLAPAALGHRLQPTGALDMLRLRAARLACEAERARAHVELVHWQFELTRRTGRALDGDWLLPSTAPHAGPYLLKLDAQPPALVKSPAVQRLATAIPALSNQLQEQATAVVEADGDRAAAAAEYQARGRGIDQVLACVHRQTVETLVFLQMLSGYNRAIAEYALAVLPASMPGDQLVQTLVILR